MASRWHGDPRPVTDGGVRAHTRDYADQFQAYRKRPSERLQYAFLGFAFISMGVAVSSVITQLSAGQATEIVRILFQFSETIPFIIGFQHAVRLAVSLRTSRQNRV